MVPSTQRTPGVSIESLSTRAGAALARALALLTPRRRRGEGGAGLRGAPLSDDRARYGVIVVAGGAVLVAAVALYLALWTPGAAGLTTARLGGRSVVTWVAPNSPAETAGIQPGDTIAQDGGHGLTRSSTALIAWEGSRRIGVTTRALTPTGLDLLDAALGLCLLLFGASVRLKSLDRAAGAAFWRMCLLASLALTLLPATAHGVLWATVLAGGALRLFGPALLDVALAFPGRRRGPERPSGWSPAPHWLPALTGVLLYAVSWPQPALRYGIAHTAAGLLLAGYILAACVHVVAALRAPLRPPAGPASLARARFDRRNPPVRAADHAAVGANGA